MPKPHTYPTLFDDVLQLNISKINKWGYLKHGTQSNNTVIWSTTKWGGFKEEIGRISISVNMKEMHPYIELNYKYGDEPRKYKVMLESMPSNLGKGKMWYFLCPSTNKRCRKLYSISGYFLHREAFNGCMYESQTQTKKWREMERVYGASFDIEKLYRELSKKHFKKFYKGKPTKRYVKLKEKIRQAESIPYQDIEMLMVYGV